MGGEGFEPLSPPADEGDTDQETDRLLGQQRAEDPSYGPSSCPAPSGPAPSGPAVGPTSTTSPPEKSSFGGQSEDAFRPPEKVSARFEKFRQWFS